MASAPALQCVSTEPSRRSARRAGPWRGMPPDPHQDRLRLGRTRRVERRTSRWRSLADARVHAVSAQRRFTAVGRGWRAARERRRSLQERGSLAGGRSRARRSRGRRRRGDADGRRAADTHRLDALLCSHRIDDDAAPSTGSSVWSMMLISSPSAVSVGIGGMGPIIG